jgi:type II secretory pathway pseudopilin PulG
VQNDLVVVAALFACSLAAAVVLFKILQSTAVIQKKEYQVGGAAAGFLLIYAALYGSYHQLQSASLAACEAGLSEDARLLEDVTVQGTIDPPVKRATVILGRDSTTSDDGGRFLVKTKGKPLSVYVISEGAPISHTIFPGEDLKTIKIP